MPRLQCSTTHPYLHRRSANNSKLVGIDIHTWTMSLITMNDYYPLPKNLYKQALICMVDKKTGEKSKTRPRFVKQDQVCIARLRAAGTICLETFKDFPQMGRFTLRDEGKKLRKAL